MEVIDLGLIESALNRDFMTFDGKELYESTEMKIAVMILLLKLNNISIKYSQQELIDLGLKAAEGKYNENDILTWIESHK